MKKKIISCTLIAALACGMVVMAGCGSDSSSSGSSSSSEEAEEAEEEAEEAEEEAADAEEEAEEAEEEASAESSDEVTVTSYGEYTEEDPYHCVFAYIEVVEQDNAATQAVEDALNAYTIPTYHIEVELLPLNIAESSTNIQLMMSGGDELDIIPIFYNEASSWISMGGIYDMGEFMYSTPEGEAILAEMGDYVDAGVMNGVLYGLPANKENMDLGGLCMRADICDELGITEKYNLTPTDDYFNGTCWSWDDAADVLEIVHEAYPNMTALYLNQSDLLVVLQETDKLVDGFGGLDLQADRTSTEVVNIYDTQTFHDTCEMLAEWYDAGYVYKDAATDTQGSATMMKAGNTFSYMTSIKPGFLAEAKASNGCDCYVMYCKMDPEPDDTNDGMVTTISVSFYNTGICSNAKDPEMAFKFVAAMYTDPVVMNFWQYGIEGVNYQILDDGTIYYVDGEDDSNYAYHQNSGWLMGNQMLTYVWNDGTKDVDYWDSLTEYNEHGYFSPAYGFMWDSSDFSTEVTALTNAYNTYIYTLLTGSEGVSRVDETIENFTNALEQAGLEDVMAAKQEQLDAWLAEQD